MSKTGELKKTLAAAALQLAAKIRGR